MSYSNFSDKSGPGGVVYNPATAYAREMAKWEMAYSPYGPPGRPREQHGFHEYPAMFYKMKRGEIKSTFVVVDSVQAADEIAAANLLSRGYVQGRKEAEEELVAHEQALAVAEAELEHDRLNMSDKARAESQRVLESTGQHIGEIPETPIRKRQVKE